MPGRGHILILLLLLCVPLVLASPASAHDDGYVSPTPSVPSGAVGQGQWLSPATLSLWLPVVVVVSASFFILHPRTRRRVLPKGASLILLPLLVITLFAVSSMPLAALPRTELQSSPALSQAKVVTYNSEFQSGYARGWSVQPGIPGTPSVQLALDGGARVLAPRGSSGGGFIVNYLEGQEWQDLYLQTSVKALNGSVLGIDFRRSWTASNFTTYQALLDYGGGHVQLGKFLQAIPNPASVSILAQSDYSLSLGTWYSITVNATGSRIKIGVDNQQLIDFTDPQPLLSGTIAFEISDVLGAMDIGGVSVTATVPPQSTWQQLNGPSGGQIGNIAIDPSNPSVIYAAAIHTGLMKSTNKGDYWHEVAYTNGVGGTKVADVVIAPSNSSVVYITILDTASGGGAWRSDDGGQHWRQLLRGNPGFYLFSIAVSPTNPNLVYAGTQSGMVPGSEGTAEIYRSTDGGDTWSALYAAQVQHIVISESNPNTIYVGTDDQGVLKSVDGGATWKQMNTGILPSDIPPGDHAPRVDRVAVDPSNPDIAMIHLGDVNLGGRDPNTGNAYVTRDGGNTWTLAVPQLAGTQVIVAIGMASSNSKVLYEGGVDLAVGTGLVWRSDDQGNTWKLVNSGSVAGVPQVIAIEPRNPDSLYMGTLSRGVYRSQDGGATWVRVETGFVGGGVYAVAVNPLNSNMLLAADGVSTWANSIPYHGYMTESLDGGVSWRSVPNSPSRVSVIQFDPKNPNIIYAGTGGPPGSNGVGVYKSVDGGRTWTLKNSGMGNVSISSLMINSSNTNILLVGTGHRPYSGTEGSGVFRSRDGGETWKKVNLPNLSVPAIVMDPKNPSVVYAATMGGGVYKSTDGGLDWAQVNSGINNLMIYGLAINPNQPNTLYAGSNPFYAEAADVHREVYKSTNGGASWKVVLSPGDVEWIFVDPVNPSYVYVVEHAGNWFWSPDGGTSWLIGSQSLTRLGGHAYPFAAAIDAGSHSLYVGTCGRGVFINHLAQAESSLPTWLNVHYGSGGFSTLFKSNSSLSNFAFSQATRSLTFAVSGRSGSKGLTNVTISSSLLVAPFTASLDGVPLTITSSASPPGKNATSLVVVYSHTGVAQQLSIQGSLAPIHTTINPLVLQVTIGNAKFSVGVNSNSTVSGLGFDPQGRVLAFNVSGPDGTKGYTNVTWSKTLLNGSFTATMDGNQIPFRLKENSSNYFLYVSYTHSRHVIRILGTTAVPEFASPSLPLLAAASAVALGMTLARIRRNGRYG